MSLLRHNVKHDWIKEGDENSTYFHACLRKRRQQNHVYRIRDTDGERKDNPKDVEDAFLKYYDNLLGS